MNINIIDNVCERIEMEIDNVFIKDSYEHIMYLYADKEIVPVSAIKTILKHHLPSCKTVIKNDELGNEIVIKVQIKDLLKAKIKNWHGNRPPDKVRCNDIALWFYNNSPKINTSFYMIYNNVKQRFEIFDGIHRLTALRQLKEVKEDEDTENKISAYSKIENQEVIVYMYFNTTEGQVIDLFTSLNKCVSVPELYSSNQKEEKRNAIEDICKEWQKKYKGAFSPSTNPNLGRMNRDTFIDLLDKLYEKHQIDCSDPDVLRERLNIVNAKIRDEWEKRKTLKVAEKNAYVKCQALGCYLFLYKKDVLLEMI
jgi:hypothetical protein